MVFSNLLKNNKKIESKNILFVTTSSLSSNPRLLKEVDAALFLSYDVSIISFNFDNWSEPLNEQIKSTYRSRVSLIEIAAGRRPFLPWFLSSLLHQCCFFLAKLRLNHPFIISQALQKRTILLVINLKRLRQHIDLIVAHNPGSFYPVMQWAKRRKIPYGIDIEDYHPGETNNLFEATCMRLLMQQTLDKASYVTVAAPLILEYVKRDLFDKINKPQVILNYFSKKEFVPPQSIAEEEHLRMVWFSQYIAAGRGLELILDALKEISNVEFHLYGKVDSNFAIEHINSISNVYIHDPLPQSDLHAELSKYDIGVAIEDAGANLNRNICLTNKLLAFIQSGLFILATDTHAQVDFLNIYPHSRLFVSNDKESFYKQILKLIQNRSTIRKEAFARYSLAASSNAEIELDKLKLIWNQFIDAC